MSLSDAVHYRFIPSAGDSSALIGTEWANNNNFPFDSFVILAIFVRLWLKTMNHKFYVNAIRDSQAPECTGTQRIWSQQKYFSGVWVLLSSCMSATAVDERLFFLLLFLVFVLLLLLRLWPLLANLTNRPMEYRGRFITKCVSTIKYAAYQVQVKLVRDAIYSFVYVFEQITLNYNQFMK